MESYKNMVSLQHHTTQIPIPVMIENQIQPQLNQMLEIQEPNTELLSLYTA